MITFETFFNKCVNYSRHLQTLFSDRPLILKKGKFLKIAVRPAVIRHLNKEVENTSKAQMWDFYSGLVVPMRKITPFIAVSRLISKPSDKTWNNDLVNKLCKMIDISINNRVHTLEAPKKPARQIIESWLDHLQFNLTGNRPFYSEFDDCLNSGYFSFKVPETPMHGDFFNHNTLIENGKLWLVDWEYAFANGSILYDWWLLKYSIEKHAIETTNVQLSQKQELKIKEFYTFLDTILDELQLTMKQFNTFNLAMFVGINFTHSKARKIKGFQKMRTHLYKTILTSDYGPNLNPEPALPVPPDYNL